MAIGKEDLSLVKISDLGMEKEEKGEKYFQKFQRKMERKRDN